MTVLRKRQYSHILNSYEHTRQMCVGSTIDQSRNGSRIHA